MPTPNEMLNPQGGELDPALKRSRLEALYGPGYQKFLTPAGNFEIPVGVAQPMAQGPLESPQGPAPFKKGALGVAQSLLSTGGLLSQAIGAQDWADALYEKADDYSKRIEAIPSRVARVEDIASLKDAAVFAYERIAENVPMLATLLLPGGAVSMGARGIGLSAQAAKAAGWSSAFLTDVGLATGESIEIARRAGQDPNDIRVIGSGIGKAMLDFVPFFALAQKLGIGPIVQKEIVSTLVEKGFLKRAASNIGTLIATEVPTEVMQEGINIALDRSLQKKEGALTPEEISQLKNSAAGALAVSLGLGAAGGVFKPGPAGENRLPGEIASQEELRSADEAAMPEEQRTAPGMQQQNEEAVNVKKTGTALVPFQDDVQVITPEIIPRGEIISRGRGPIFSRSNPFTYANLYDKKTGEMMITGKEYTQALITQSREIKYDPFSDAISGMDFKPVLTPTRTGWYFDPQAGFVYDKGKAKVEMTNEGFAVATERGPVGVYPSIEEAMKQGEKYAYDNESISGVDTNGEYSLKTQDISKQVAQALKTQGSMTPSEAALVQLEDARPARKPVEANETQRSQSPQMEKLLSLRMEYLSDKTNYRDTDGQMKVSAKGRLDILDERIQKLSDRLGIRNPLAQDTSLKGPKTEDIFEERAMKTDRIKYPNLSEGESSLLNSLEEKERTPGEGLTLKEYEKLERLIAKREGKLGVPSSEKVQLSDNDFENLLKEAKKKKFKDYSMKRKKSEGIMPAMVAEGETSVMRGEQEIARIRKQEGQTIVMMPNGEEVVYANEAEAFENIVNEDLNSRKDYRRDSVKPPEAPKRNTKLEAEITKAIKKIYDNLKIKPRVDLTHTYNKDVFPEGTDLAREVKGYRGFISMKEAGRIYILLDNIKSVEQGVKTFVHEVFAHFGLRAVLGEEQLSQLLRVVGKERAAEIYAKRSPLPDGSPNTSPMTLEEVEEFIASKFEELYGNPKFAQDSFMSKLLALFRRFMRSIGISNWTDKDLADVLRDVGKGLRRGVTPRYTQVFWNPRTSRETLAATIGEREATVVEGEINSLAEVWRAKAALGILTPLQVGERYKLQGLQEYLKQVSLWWARKRTLTTGATLIAEDWQKMPRKAQQKLSNALFETTQRSDELGRKLSNEELQAIFKKENLGKPEMDLYQRIEQEFNQMLGALEQGLKNAVIRQNVSSPEEATELMNLWKNPDKTEFLSKSKSILGNLELGARLNDIEAQMSQLRNRNYFPYSRFGQYAITIRAKKDMNFQGNKVQGPRDGKRGGVVIFETFESAQAQISRFEELKKQYPSSQFSINSSVLSEQEYQFLGMPPALYDAIKGQLNLTKAQEETLQEIFYLRSPGRNFLRHLVKRKGTAGYSQDALRVFSSYMVNAGNHIARIEYSPDMVDALQTMKKASDESGSVAGLVSNYFQKHYDYITNPKSDWAQLRAMGFLWYLGANVKSALVNLTQVPMVAYPYLASLYGDAKSAGAIASSYKRVVDWRRGKTVLSPEMDAAVRRGIAEGFLDESLATELAGIAEGSTLSQILPSDKGEQILNRVSYYASFLFRHAEKFNREVTFLAAMELGKSSGLDSEAAFNAARKAVQTAMFEYAKWNRPEFMRGKKSVFFLFWNYMQHLSFLAFGGQGTKTALRMNLLLLVAAGLQGLPFAENILDMIDWTGTQVKEAVGSENPKLDLRNEIREIAGTIFDRPDLALHGLSRYYGLGPLHVAELFGAPIPNVDISGSLSAGSPIPGVQEALQPTRDPDKQFGQVLTQILGPVVGVGYNFWKALTSQDPDEWKSWERALPTSLRSASQSLRLSERGEETFRGGGAREKFDPLNIEHRGELIAKALGFQPTRLSQSYEVTSAQEELRQYWTIRRAFVLENYAYAILSEDSGLVESALKKIRDFNESAPSPQLRLSVEKIQASLRQRARLRSLREMGLPNERAFQFLYSQQAALIEGDNR